MSKKGLRSNIEWIEWGKRDPLYGISAGTGKQKTGPSPWTEEEVWATGEADWRDIFAQWSQFGFDRESCLEIGCGAGRLSGPLSRCFRTLHTVDVSPEMIELARKRAPNANFYLTDGATLPLPDGAVTAALSTFVFQHFDRLSDAECCFREIDRVLTADGSMLIQLPVYSWPAIGSLFRPLYNLKKIAGDMRANFRRFQMQRGRGQPFMRLLTYEIGWVFDTLAAIGFTQVELRFFRFSKDRRCYSWVLARKENDPR